MTARRADCGHDGFDEDCGPCWTRVTYYGTECSPELESWHAPRRGDYGGTPTSELLALENMRGTYDWSEAAHVGRGGSVR